MRRFNMEKKESISTPEAKTSELIAVDDIRPSPANPRVFRGKKKELEELAKNIRAVGLISPITVRPVHSGNGGPKYEIVSGERRWRACRLIWSHIPAFVYELSDREAHEITVTENLQREDLTPLEEANGIQTLLESGKEPKVIADNLGKPLSWVMKRAKLRDLSKKWKKAMEDPESPYYHWTVSHFEMVARFPEPIQNEIYDMFEWYGDDMTTGELRRELDRYQLKLRSAPWKLDDGDLVPGAGACAKCQKRASCQPSLFDEQSIPAERDMCLDKTCWNGKMLRFLEAEEKRLRRKQADLVLLEIGTGRIIPEDSPLYRKTVKEYWNYEPCRKTDKGALPVLLVSGPEVGRFCWMRNTRDKSSSSAPRYDENGNKLPKPLSERREMLKKKRERAFIGRIASIVAEEIEKPDLIKSLTEEKVLSAVYCRLLAGHIYPEEMWEHYRRAVEKYRMSKDEMLVDFMKNVLEESWLRRLDFLMRETLAETSADYACKVAEFLGIDTKPIEREIEKEIPEPKSWANLNEDGTPKKNGIR